MILAVYKANLYPMFENGLDTQFKSRKEDWESSKAMRFYMPKNYVRALEELTKTQRDKLMIQALKENYIIEDE